MGGKWSFGCVALALLLVGGGAAAAGACVEFGCARADDTTGDGDADTVRASSGTHFTSTGLLVNASGVLVQYEVAGDEETEPFLVASGDGRVGFAGNGTPEAVENASAGFHVERVDHHDGHATPLLTAGLRVADGDGDGAADHGTLAIGFALP